MTTGTAVTEEASAAETPGAAEIVAQILEMQVPAGFGLVLVEEMMMMGMP